MTHLYNPNDGLTGRDGGPYLDEVQAVEAEKRRADVEGRKPDLENPGADAGIPLSLPAEILSTYGGVNAVPSKQNALDNEAARFFKNAADEVDSELRVWGEINDDEVESQKDDATEQKQSKEYKEVSDSDMFTSEAAGKDPLKSSDPVAKKSTTSSKPTPAPAK